MNRITSIRGTGVVVALVAAGLLTGEVATAKERTVRPHEGGIIVRYDASATARDRLAARRDAGVRRVRTLRFGDGLYELVSSTDAAGRASRALESRADVVFAEPNDVVRVARTPNDARFSELDGMRAIRAPLAWDAATGAGATVAVADTGVTLSHPDLADNAFVNASESGDGKESNGVDDDDNGFVDDYSGWDFYYDINDASDNEAHGTHVAGTIAARGDNGIGVAGVSWRANIMPLAFLGPDGSGASTAAAEALDYAGKMGADVVNGSFASTSYNQLIRDVIEAHPETLYVFAAGNESSNVNVEPRYPCAYDLPNIVCVAAVDDGGALAGFSNYGNRRVHLGAPGVSVLSTVPGADYASADGTSMAAPHVSGAATLLAGQFPWANATRLRAALIDTVARTEALRGRVSSNGQLDVSAALSAADDTSAPTAPALGALPPVSASPEPPVTWTPASDPDSGVSAYEVLAGPEKVAASERGDGTQPGYWTKPLPDGVHALSVRAIDREGNASASAPVNVRIDTTPPGVPVITQPRNPQRKPGPLRVTWNAALDAGPISRYEVSLDGRLAQTVPGNVLFGRVIVAKPERTAIVTVTAVDEAGHRSAASTKPVVVDATRPRVRMQIRPRVRRLRSRRGQVITCRSNEAVVCSASIVLRPKEKRRAKVKSARIVGPVKLTDRGNRIATGRLKLGKKARSALRRLGRRPRVQIVVIAEDRAGNRSAARRIVRLR